MSASVLILEDDSTQGAALQAFFEKAGIKSLLTSNADEARTMLRENRIKLLLVDCLLPGGSGVDFVSSIRSEFPETVLEVVLMSGIFIEPSFIKDSTRSVKATQFLRKPFDIEALAPYRDKYAIQVEKQNPRKLLYQIFGNKGASDRDKRKLLESLEELHGFDLPFIYRFLIHSGISGNLNIVDTKGQVFGVTFAKGTIVGVDLADSQTFIGKLLIESGYILPEDLEIALNLKSNKKVGERLIHGQFLSPHGFEIVLANQMSLRLSRTIVDESVRVNFVASDIETQNPHIDEDMLNKFMHDWIASKIEPEWLKAHFTPWGNSILVPSPEFRQDHPALRAPLVANLDKLIVKMTAGQSLNEILESKTFPEQVLLRALHFLFCSGLLIFQNRAIVRSADDQMKHLRNVNQQFQNKNPLEIYELMVRMTTASEQDAMQVYNEFVVLMGTAPTDPKIAVIYQQVKAAADRSFEVVKSGNHLKLKDELAKQEIEKKLKAGSVFDQGRQLLEKNQYSQALQFLERAEKLDSKFDKIKLYLIWCRLGMIESHPNKQMAFKAIDSELMQVTPEDKFDALFSFVMGLYQKAKGDFLSAKKNFEKAMAMDTNLIVARRELALIANANKGQKDVFNQDLKTLVGSLFSRKKAN